MNYSTFIIDGNSYHNMKSILLLLKKTVNLLPYFIIIVIYFIFISLEANKDKEFNRVIKNEFDSSNSKKLDDENIFRINIPVIPYKENGTN